VLPANWRHGDKGSHNSPQNKDFIMCGVSTCESCAAHLQWAANNPQEIPATHLSSLKALFDEHSASLMIATPPVDVWLVGSQGETRLSVKEQILSIKAKEFSPTPEQFSDLYEAIDTSDPDSPDMMQILSKYLAKQGDGVEQFLADMAKYQDENSKDVKE